VNLMSNTNSSKGKYILAALAGAAVGGSIVALSTRALPNLMSGMMAKCKEVMAGMGETGPCTGEMCKRVMAESTCDSEGAACHGGD
jgi:hypothetical protein